MLATFHYKQDGRWIAIQCPNATYIEFHVGVSRAGLSGGDEQGFFIEWHAPEETR